MSSPRSTTGAGRGPRSSRRRRVVILVDNDVRRDSRVQKQARSMADLGWDVRVLGLAPRGETARWRIGRARVRLVAVTTHPRPHEVRDARWRDPLAYASGQQRAQRVAAVARREADVTMRRARHRITLEGRGPLRRRVAALRLLPARARLRATTRWVRFRARRTEAVLVRRRELTAPLDRLLTRTLSRLLGRRAWRRLDPHLWDLEAAYGPAIDRLEPDLIHANDFRMLGVGARAKMRAALRATRVPLIWDAHEFLPGTRPWDSHPRWHVAQLAHEREFAAYADEVVTVSTELAELLVAEHGLERLPTVVLNCPLTSGGEPREPDAAGVRELCGVDAATPILVYSGSLSPQRGLLTVIDALPSLPGVVLALVVAARRSVALAEVLARADELGVRDRVHLLPYVAPEHVVDYLSSADIGLIPIQHFPNHEIALITKFFEYSHARLPIVVSDVRAMAAAVEQTGQGEVFGADDPASFAAAVERILADPERYRMAYTSTVPLQEWTWERQAQVLDAVYRRAVSPTARTTVGGDSRAEQ